MESGRVGKIGQFARIVHLLPPPPDPSTQSCHPARCSDQSQYLRKRGCEPGHVRSLDPEPGSSKFDATISPVSESWRGILAGVLANFLCLFANFALRSCQWVAKPYNPDMPTLQEHRGSALSIWCQILAIKLCCARKQTLAFCWAELKSPPVPRMPGMPIVPSWWCDG